jgi:CheY-like chemotaxis protein
MISHSKKNFMETRRESVLVVDDYPDCADTLVEMLRVCGFNAQACYSTEVALTLASVLKPQVVLVEPAMAGQTPLDGYQLAKSLRRQRNLGELLLVAFSGAGQPRDRARAEQAGFDAFVLKPGTPEEILALVRERTRPSQASVADSQGSPKGPCLQCWCRKLRSGIHQG